MRVLIAGAGTGASRKTATAHDNYDRARSQRLSCGMRLWRWRARCSSRSRQRGALSGLNHRLLGDIGVTRATGKRRSGQAVLKMTLLLTDKLPAAMLGFFIAIPFGAACLMCVQRTLALGIWFGVASGMGAAVGHELFRFLAEASAAVLAQTAVQQPLCMAGGLAFIVMGLRAYLVPIRPAHEARRRDLCLTFMSLLLSPPPTR